MRYTENYSRNPCSNKPGDFVVGDNLRRSVHVLRHEVIFGHAPSFHGALKEHRSLYVLRDYCCYWPVKMSWINHLLYFPSQKETLDLNKMLCSAELSIFRTLSFFFLYSQVQDLSNVLTLHFMLGSLNHMAREEIIYWGWNFISECLCGHFAIIFTAALAYNLYTYYVCLL